VDYLLIPGAGGRAWYWHLIAPRLAKRGHRPVAVELPAEDDTKGLSDYAHTVLDAVDPTAESVLVAASLGAFTAPLVAGLLETNKMVLVNPMIPMPGETPDAWWANTAAVEARSAQASRLGYPAEFDPGTTCFAAWPNRARL
jgi:pimeloyl-ACP methyl ester carboxylesterase